MKYVVMGAVGLIIVVGVGYLATSAPAPAEVATPAATEKDTTQADVAQAPTSTTDTTNNATATDNGAPDGDEAGAYRAYSAEAFAASDAATDVLFFHADWCPSCRALDANIVAQQADIPADVVIWQADYDTETALKREYGVVRQHSVVVLDASGNQQGSVTHPATLTQLLTRL